MKLRVQRLMMVCALLAAADCVVAEGAANEPPKSAETGRLEAKRERPAAKPAPALPQSAASSASGTKPAGGAEPIAPKPAAKLPAESRGSSNSGTSDSSAPESQQRVRSADKLGLDLSSNAPLEIDSSQIEFVDAEDGGERIRFTGGVTLKQGELQLTCATLDAYYPDGATGRPERIIADGDVVVVQGDTELRCTRAEFDDSKCRTVCFSSERSCNSPDWPEKPARLTRGDNSIEGRQLEFDLCTSKLSGSCGARVVLIPERETPGDSADRGSNQSAPTESPSAGSTKQPGAKARGADVSGAAGATAP